MIKPTHEDLNKTVAELEAEAEKAILINISRVLEYNDHGALKGLADALSAIRAPRASMSSRVRLEDLATPLMTGASPADAPHDVVGVLRLPPHASGEYVERAEQIAEFIEKHPRSPRAAPTASWRSSRKG